MRQPAPRAATHRLFNFVRVRYVFIVECFKHTFHLSFIMLLTCVGSVMTMPSSSGAAMTWHPRRDVAAGEECHN
jgi:hypothetical protein